MLEELAWIAPLLLVAGPLLLGRFPGELVLERARRRRCVSTGRVELEMSGAAPGAMP